MSIGVAFDFFLELGVKDDFKIEDWQMSLQQKHFTLSNMKIQNDLLTIVYNVPG